VGQDPRLAGDDAVPRADVVKLDLRLVQERPDPEIGMVMSAVTRRPSAPGPWWSPRASRTTATGRRAGDGRHPRQGWLYGRPEALPTELPRPDDVISLRRTWSVRDEPTPFSVVRAARGLRRGDKELLLGIAAHLEAQAVALAEGPVVLSTFEAGEDLSEDTLERYAALSARGSFVAALRTGDAPYVRDGTRGARLPDDHRLADEWSVVVVGPHYAGALVPGGWRRRSPTPTTTSPSPTTGRWSSRPAGRCCGTSPSSSTPGPASEVDGRLLTRLPLC
jgi:hypothetical protein